MGMAASQARLLSLQARQSNLEYQGQQINQERSILSQQCTALYNSLLSMTVPTPPATTDFQTIKYTGEMGATKYSFDANSVKPGNGDTYSVSLGQKSHGDSIQKNSTIARVELNSKGGIKGRTLPKYAEEGSTRKVPDSYVVTTSNPTNKMVPAEIKEFPKSSDGSDITSNYWIKDGNKFRKAVPGDDPTKCYEMKSGKPDTSKGEFGIEQETETVGADVPNYVTTAEMATIYVLQSDGTVKKADETDFIKKGSSYQLDPNKTYIQKGNNGTETYQTQGSVGGVTVAGQDIYELTGEYLEKYSEAIQNSGLVDNNGKPYSPDQFYIYFDDNGTANFVLKSDVNDGNNNATTYKYVANGEFTKKVDYNDVKITFDPANGRITEIAIPNYGTTTDENGNEVTDYNNIESWTSIPVEAETVTDDAAYKDAYAQYEYETYLYDQKNKEINAKTEIIQQEDKNLELKLQRLDNERTQITTEIEAVEKVINDNIEGSYKTFSG